MPVKLENVKVTSYQLGAHDNNASAADTNGDETFVFSPQTSQPNGDGDVDGRDFLV